MKRRLFFFVLLLFVAVSSGIQAQLSCETYWSCHPHNYGGTYGCACICSGPPDATCSICCDAQTAVCTEC